MYFDANQTYEALEQVSPPRIVVAGRRNGLLLGLVAGILIGRKSK